MAERNVTFLILAKDFASRTMNNLGDSTDRAAQKLRNLNTLGLGPLATAGAALGPALLPVLGGAVVGTAALGSAFTAAGAASLAFGSVTASVFGEVQKASAKSEDLRTKISLLNREISMAEGSGVKVETLVKSRDKALLEYKARLAELPAPIRATVVAMDSMKSAWDRFVTANRPQTLGFLTRGFNLLAAVIPKLTPLYNAGAVAANSALAAIVRWTAGGGVDRVVSFLTARAVPAFKAFGSILLSLGSGIGSLLAPFDAMTGSVLSGLDRMSASFATWAGSGGRAAMERFIAWVKENGPGAGSVISSLAKSLGIIAVAIAPLAPLSVALAAGLTSVLDAIPQPVLTAMIGSWIAWSVALQSAMIVTKVGAAVAIFAGIITGATSAVLGHTLATNASTAAKGAFAAVTGIATVAQWAWNAALLVGAGAIAILTAPITLVILGIVALGAALYLAWQRSETFRRVVTQALTAVGNAAVAVGRWFQSAWGVLQGWWTNTIGFFQALPGRIMAGIAAFPGLLFAYWKKVITTAAFIVGFGIGLVVGFFLKLPGRVMGAIRALPGALAALWSAVWSRTKSTVSAGVSAVVSFLASLPGRAGRALSSLWGRMSSAFITARSAAAAKARELVIGAITWLSQLPGRAARAIASVPSRIKGVFAGAGGWLLSAGYNLIMGLVRGIGNAVGAAVGAAQRIASSVVSGVKAGLGISSPSKVMRDQVGVWIPNGIAAGITKSAPALMSVVGAMVDNVVRASRFDVRTRVKWGTVSESRWNSLLSQGWEGNPRDRMEALYAPAGTPLAQPGRAGTGGGNMTVINVNGALDPLTVGKQIVDILSRWAQSQGKTFELAR